MHKLHETSGGKHAAPGSLYCSPSSAGVAGCIALPVDASWVPGISTYTPFTIRPCERSPGAVRISAVLTVQEILPLASALLVFVFLTHCAIFNRLFCPRWFLALFRQLVERDQRRRCGAIWAARRLVLKYIHPRECPSTCSVCSSRSVGLMDEGRQLWTKQDDCRLLWRSDWCTWNTAGP